MFWVVCYFCIVGFILLFMYSANKNNEIYDVYSIMCRYIDGKKQAFVKYIGEDRLEICHNNYTLISIDMTDDDKIRVYLKDTVVLYDDVKSFAKDWKFEED